MKNKALILFLTLFFCLVYQGKSQNPYEIREPDSAFFESYLNDTDFDYERAYKAPVQRSFFSRMLNIMASYIRTFFNAVSKIPHFYLFAGIILSIVLFFIIITKTNIYKLFYTDKAINNIPHKVTDLVEENFDIDSAIAASIQKNDYRGAIRYYYIKLLKTMNIKDIIKYRNEKTNLDYFYEISNKEIKENFKALTGIYNNVWYGKNEVNNNFFQNVSSKYIALIKKINE